MKLEKNEIELIDFLYHHRLDSEIESNNFENEEIDYMKSLEGNYKEMFDFSNCYHSDDRLTKSETKIINTIYQKFTN
ncbi:hypothetical protein FPG87_11565 [Flavobacterium psychrophilum]|uniref:hypothetical protein n=1 Tax=Flavobacterium psychrophilum TaxID=96345 RepID=UPI000903533F|nr:hypothetical protein [Flavobacterium psychrophilum]OJH11082.1 hypothetical protein FPG87_11565 [Flavobacterium psychrophilum]SNA70427.1 hypothetical protein DK150_20033 [Flavobacterium psychrophilum]